MSRIVTFFFAIFLMANLGIGVIGWVLPVGGGFLGCSSTLTEQCGTASLSVSGGIATLSISFNPAFASIPTITLGPKAWNLPAASTSTPTIGYLFVDSNSTLCTIAVCAGNTLFANIWDSFPVALTPIFGETVTNHALAVDLTDMTGFRFGVDCIVGSSSATAIFKVQYSTNQGVTWTDMGAAQNVNMNSCNGPAGGTNPWASTSYTAVPAGAQTTTTFLRVVGLNGGGAGDNILFDKVFVDFQPNPGLTGYNLCTAYWTQGILPLKAFNINIRCTSNTISGTFLVSWIASI